VQLRDVPVIAPLRGARERLDLLGLIEVEHCRRRLPASRRAAGRVVVEGVAVLTHRVPVHRADDLAVAVDLARAGASPLKRAKIVGDLTRGDLLRATVAEVLHQPPRSLATTTSVRHARLGQHFAVADQSRGLRALLVLQEVKPLVAELTERETSPASLTLVLLDLGLVEMVGAHQLEHPCPGLRFGERAVTGTAAPRMPTAIAVRLDPGAPERPHDRLAIT
jgi:hypothetical protein